MLSGLRGRSAREVFDDHLRRAQQGDVDGDIETNLAEDAVILVGGAEHGGVYRGREDARRLARLLAQQLPGARFAYTTRLVEGPFALLEWSAEADGAAVHDGTDSFVIRDGQIVAQTIHYTVESAPSRS